MIALFFSDSGADGGESALQRPDLSYAQLAALAIYSSPNHSATVATVCSMIITRHVHNHVYMKWGLNFFLYSRYCWHHVENKGGGGGVLRAHAFTKACMRLIPWPACV